MNHVNRMRVLTLPVLASVLAGCTSFHRADVYIYSMGSATAAEGDMELSGELRTTSRFKPSDVVLFYARLSWPGAERPGDRVIEWRWMKGEKTIAASASRYCSSPPHDVRTRMHASVLGDGAFTVAAYLDGRLLDQQLFTVGPAAEPGRQMSEHHSTSGGLNP